LRKQEGDLLPKNFFENENRALRSVKRGVVSVIIFRVDFVLHNTEGVGDFTHSNRLMHINFFGLKGNAPIRRILLYNERYSFDCHYNIKRRNDMNYQEWLDEWLCNYVQPSSKKRPYERYGEIVRQHIIPALGAIELDELTPFSMQRFVTELLTKGNLKTGKGLSANSVNAIITVMQSSLRMAYTLGYAEVYTADKIKRPRLDEKRWNVFRLPNKRKWNNIF
jgi:hypothetical protein